MLSCLRQYYYSQRSSSRRHRFSSPPPGYQHFYPSAGKLHVLPQLSCPYTYRYNIYLYYALAP